MPTPKMRTVECDNRKEHFIHNPFQTRTIRCLLTLLSPLSMTTVDTYRSTQLELPSDVPSNARRPHPSPNTITRNYIPPAVPSPPRESAQQSPPRRPVKRLSRDITIKMASEESSQWLFTDSELASTPSMLDGLPSAEERGRRAKGVNFIIQAGILLKLPQLTLATASVFFHRFYMRQSMVVERGGLHHYVCQSL